MLQLQDEFLQPSIFMKLLLASDNSQEIEEYSKYETDYINYMTSLQS